MNVYRMVKGGYVSPDPMLAAAYEDGLAAARKERWPWRRPKVFATAAHASAMIRFDKTMGAAWPDNEDGDDDE